MEDPGGIVHSHTLRAPALVAAAAALVLGTLGTSVAEAKPTKPGSVPHLVGVATWHTGTTYDVHATWDAVANATSYRASIVRSGATLASKTLTVLGWDPTITSGPGQVTLQVQAVVNHRKSAVSKYTVDLPDKVAPTGTFVTSKDVATKVGTITQTALDDDSGTAGITRTVDWGDSSLPVTWTGDAPLTHTYQAIGRYVPTVTVTDASHNSGIYTLAAIVLGDVTAPSGTVALAPSTGWAGFTRVSATPSGLSDDVSPLAMIGIHVTWGDGTTSDSTGTAALTHMYAAAGTYPVATTITDEAGNQIVLPSSVTITSDTTGPKVTLTLPAKTHSVRAWKTLRGKATDLQTGVKKVSVRAVEKRGHVWYGYNASTHKWVKASSRVKAYSRSVAFSRSTDDRHRWSAKLARLRKGTLEYRVKAVDRVGNKSGTIVHRAKLTSA
jgi:hypothetical protein